LPGGDCTRWKNAAFSRRTPKAPVGNLRRNGRYRFALLPLAAQSFGSNGVDFGTKS
jgi:hypothetical protein